MAVSSGCSSTVSALLQPPHPKSPLEYPDLYGKRRQLAKVQLLEREIGFLQEELKSIGGLQPASQCCKEFADFVEANTDPLVPASTKIRSSCRFWKWICAASCFNFSWICSYGCCPDFKMPSCCICNLCNCHSCVSCSISSCKCCSCPHSRCFDKISCRNCCCTLRCPSCPDFSCCTLQCPSCPDFSCCTLRCPSCTDFTCSRWTCSCSENPKVPQFSCCTKKCCYPCCFCY